MEFDTKEEFWEKAEEGDTLKPGIIKKGNILFPKVE